MSLSSAPPPSQTSASSADTAAAARALAAWWRQAGVSAPALDVLAKGGATSRPSPAASAPQPQRSERRPDPPSNTKAVSNRHEPPHETEAPAHHAGLAKAGAALANAAQTLDELHQALKGFDRHPLHALAQNTVFARGDQSADVMVVGEAPGRDEDREGAPFVGRSGRLLDAMFAAIGLSADRGLYITNVLNWRPPANRPPSTEEIQLCMPFITRHIALKKPKILVFAGGVPAQALLGVTTGITRLRGQWRTYTPRDEAHEPTLKAADAIPALPIYHPAYLLRRPAAKAQAWADLLSLESKLAER